MAGLGERPGVGPGCGAGECKASRVTPQRTCCREPARRVCRAHQRLACQPRRGCGGARRATKGQRQHNRWKRCRQTAAKQEAMTLPLVRHPTNAHGRADLSDRIPSFGPPVEFCLDLPRDRARRADLAGHHLLGLPLPVTHRDQLSKLAGHLPQPLRLDPRINRQLLADPLPKRFKLRPDRRRRFPGGSEAATNLATVSRANPVCRLISRADKPSTRYIRRSTARRSTPADRPSSPTATDQARIKDQPDKTCPTPGWPRFQPAQVAWFSVGAHTPALRHRRARARERGVSSGGLWGLVVQASPISSSGVGRSPMYPGTVMNSSGTSRTHTPDMRIARPACNARPGCCRRRRLESALTPRVDQLLPSSPGTLRTSPDLSRAVVSVGRSWVERVDVCRAGLSFPCCQTPDCVLWAFQKAAVLAKGRRDPNTEVGLHA